MSMSDSQGNPGLRLLSLDGGGIRGMSELLILQEVMQRIQAKENLPSVPLPCEYFDMIGGTSTGGLIALMLGRLRMPIDDAIAHYDSLAKKVFANGKKMMGDGSFKSSVLEGVIKDIVRGTTGDVDSRMMDTRPEAEVCKTFVCARAAEDLNAGKSVLFRTYRVPKNASFNCAIWEAARATSAAPTIFKRIVIGGPGSRQPYIDGGVGVNNPTESILQEAELIFPNRYVACIISIGTGQAGSISIPKPGLFQRAIPLDVIKAMTDIATDCETVSQAMSLRFKNSPGVYFRFNVAHGMQSIKLAQWDQLDKVSAHTLQYLKMHEVDQNVDLAVEVVRKRPGVIATMQINGVVGPKRKLVLKPCPSPTNVFTGRKDILSQLHRYFTPSSRSAKPNMQRRFVLYGLGGGGKTQIALKFVEECQVDAQPPRFSDVFFIDASTAQTIRTNLKNIALAKGIGESASDAMDWLTRRREEWLLLFNNADDPKLNLNRFFPSGSHGNILITSRNHEICLHAGHSSYKVSSMTPEDARKLLLEMIENDNTKETQRLAASIVKELGYHALAVVQAGAYISTSDDLRGYLSHYGKCRMELLREHGQQTIDHYRWTVYTTWKISYEKLTPIAAEFLQLCAFMHHDGISEEIFRKAAAAGINESPSPVMMFLNNFLDSHRNWDSTLFLNMTKNLRTYSLIDFDSAHGVFSIHPLVHAWIRTTVANDERVCAYTKALLGMSIRSSTDYAFRRTLLPHVDEALRYGTATEPDILQFTLVYWGSGRWNEAVELEIKVLETRMRVFGVDHPDTLEIMHDLAITYVKQGHWKEAEQLAVEVLEKRKRVLGVGHPQTLKSMSILAYVYIQQGRWKEAEAFEIEVQSMGNTVLAVDHPDKLMSMNNLMMAYLEQGRLQEAEELGISVSSMYGAVFGVNNPETLASMNNLATTYLYQGRWKEAEKLFIYILKTAETVFGVGHLLTLGFMNNLGVTYHRQERLKMAEKLFNNILARSKMALGSNHPLVLNSMSNLAQTWYGQGRRKEGGKLGIKVLEMRETALGAGHPDTLMSMSILAQMSRGQRRWEESEKLEVKVLEMSRTVLGADHPDTLTRMNKLATLYRQQGRHKKAEELLVDTVQKTKEVLGVDDPHTLVIMNNLADVYHERGRWQDAEKLQIAVLARRKKVLGTDHPDTLISMNNLASTYFMQGRYKQAEELGLETLKMRKAVLGMNHPATATSMGNLASTYCNQGRWKEAEELGDAVLKMSQTETVPRVAHRDTLKAMRNLARAFYKQGRRTDAERLYIGVLEMSKREFGANHRHTREIMNNLAHTYPEEDWWRGLLNSRTRNGTGDESSSHTDKHEKPRDRRDFKPLHMIQSPKRTNNNC